MPYKQGSQFTKPHCTKTTDKLHHVGWNYKDIEFEDDCCRIEGNCAYCGLRFQKTFQQTEGLTVFSKSNNTFDFNKEVVEVN